MATTAGGSPYVESSDLVADYPTVSLAVADKIDTKANTASPVFSGRTTVRNDVNGLSIGAEVHNISAGAGIAALGFNVAAIGTGESNSTKAGIGLVRNAGNGRGDLAFYLRTTDDTANFDTGDQFMRVAHTTKAITGSGLSLGAWTSYTPTFTAQFTLGNGTVDAYYCQIGKIVFTQGDITFGSTTAFGTNATDTVQFSLPVTAQGTAGRMRMGMVTYVDVSLGRGYPGRAGAISTTEMAVTYGITNVTANTVTSATFNNSLPVAPAVSDSLAWFMTYEAA